MTDVVEQLLVETDLVDDIPLREYLVELQNTARAVRPMPSAELAALLVPAPRRTAGRRRRVIITTMIVAGILGAGATAAAASPEIRDATGRAIQAVVGTLLPASPAVPGDGRPVAPDTHPPKPRETSGTSHPGPTDHPGATDHPSPTIHPGKGGTQGNSGSNPPSGTPLPGSGSSGQPSPSHGGGSQKP
jgi:hypothetical protein